MTRLAYLISRYPAVSHTFILREVQALRRLGQEILTVSVNPPDRPLAELSEEEQREAESTYVLKSLPAMRIVLALLRCALKQPLGLLRGAALAIRLGGGSPASTVRRLFYLAEALLVGEWMRRNGLHHLHVHFATPAATVALLVQRVFGFQYSMTVHGPDEFYEVNEYHLREKIEAASFICAISQYCRSQLMKLSDPRSWGKLELSRLGVDPASFAPKPHSQKGEAFQILCVGRLTPAKGQAVLLEAVRMLQDQGRQIQATFAGDGPDRQRLQTRARWLGVEDRCRFLGAVNPDRVRALYETADVFVLPSFAEGIPVVLMEAMAMGVPCVSTTVNGIPELIESGRQGLLVPPSDASALASAIACLMDDPSCRAALAEEGREKVKREYELARNAGRLAGIFQARLRDAA